MARIAPVRTVPTVLALLAWFSCAWFGSWEGNPNNATRLFAAIELVEKGSPRIDRFAPLTIDKAVIGGHAYLDKAPGMTLMAVPAVVVADTVNGERGVALAASGDLSRYLRLLLRIAVAIGPAVLAGLATAALWSLAIEWTASGAAALFAALGFALGTPVWGWSTTVLGHAVVGDLYLIALWAFGRGRVRWALAGGLALGWAVSVEAQAMLAGAVLAGYGAWRCWRDGRRLGAAALGGVAGVMPLLAWNWWAFGGPFHLGYGGVQGFDGMHQGLFGLTAPAPRVLWEIVFGTRRGLLWVAPVLVMAPIGLFGLIAAGRSRALGLAAAGGATVVLLVNAAYVYWDGGNATGPRHAVPAIGLLALGLAPFWAGLTTRGGRVWATAVLAGSVAINALIAGCDVFAPPFDPWPLRWVVTQHLLRGDVTSLASDGGWPGWSGFAIWAAVAGPTMVWLVRRTLRDSGPRVRLPASV